MARYVKLAMLDQVQSRGILEVEWEGRLIALLLVEKTLFAIDAVCPHQGGPLAEGRRDGTIVSCPWHGWQFDLTNGDCLTARTVHQQIYPVRVEAGEILVDVG